MVGVNPIFEVDIKFVYAMHLSLMLIPESHLRGASPVGRLLSGDQAYAPRFLLEKTVTGLRERKRLERRKEILLAAARIFKERGYDEARIEEIAERADVSPGTVYNYFPTKDTLLVELAALYRSEAEKSRLQFIENPANDPVAACAALYSNMVEQALEYFDRRVWRHVLVAGILGSWDVVRRNWWNNEQKMIDDQRRMLSVLKRRQCLPEDLDEHAWAQVVHSVGLFSWQRFVAHDDAKVQDLKKEVRALLRCIFSRAALTKSHRRTKSNTGSRNLQVRRNMKSARW
jgi:AcrR family transcriptional regulator